MRFTRTLAVFLVVAAVSGCTRGLSERERDWVTDLTGIDAEQVRVRQIFTWFEEPHLPADDEFHTAFVQGNTIYLYREDYAADLTCPLDDDDAGVRGRTLLSEAAVHIWQHQNKVKGYSYAGLVAEHAEHADGAGKYTLQPGKAFGDYRFEQQAAIVTDFAMKYWDKRTTEQYGTYKALLDEPFNTASRPPLTPC